MKRFMFLSIGVLCLAIAVLIGFYVGSQRADAQTPAGTVFFAEGSAYQAILPNGDIYYNYYNINAGGLWPAAAYRGNFWGGTVSTDKSTWSGMKEQYKK